MGAVSQGHRQGRCHRLRDTEYNRSIPGNLKNALDVGSRPQGQNVWAGKPAAIMSITPYKLGAFGANHAIGQALVLLGVPAMQQPEAYIGGAAELFDDRNRLNSQGTRKFFEKKRGRGGGAGCA